MRAPCKWKSWFSQACSTRACRRKSIAATTASSPSYPSRSRTVCQRENPTQRHFSPRLWPMQICNSSRACWKRMQRWSRALLCIFTRVRRSLSYRAYLTTRYVGILKMRRMLGCGRSFSSSLQARRASRSWEKFAWGWFCAGVYLEPAQRTCLLPPSIKTNFSWIYPTISRICARWRRHSWWWVPL